MADVNKMITHAQTPKDDGGDGDDVLAMAVTLATLTGVRRGELAGLRWDDVDEESCSIRIERQWIPGSGGQYLGPCKSSDGARAVVLGAEGMALLDRYRRRMVCIPANSATRSGRNRPPVPVDSGRGGRRL